MNNLTFLPLHRLQEDTTIQEKIDAKKAQKQQLKTMKTMQGFQTNILSKSILSCYMGGVLGYGWGLFTALLDSNRHGMYEMHLPSSQGGGLVGSASLRQQFRFTMQRSYFLAKGFGGFGLAYTFTEGLAEKTRGKHDRYNTAGSGCFLGGALGARAGPQAAMFGCVGLAAFSLAIDTFFDL